MATNESIYGSKADWIVTSTTYPSGDDNNYYLANFGSNTQYDVSTLRAGIDNGKLSLGTPLDKSLAWCGLGTESAFSHIECYNNKPWEDENDAFKMINKDNRFVTNFALVTRLVPPGSLPDSAPSNWYYADTSNTVYGSRARWYPDGQDGTSSTTGNFNVGLKPYAQIPIKNCILVPRVKCAASVTASGTAAGLKSVLLWEYLNTNNSVNYTTHPYIFSIGVNMYGYVSSNTNVRSSRLTNSQFVVTDETGAGKGQPYNTAQPSRVQPASYQYYAFGSSSTYGVGMPIMGMLSSNSDFMLLPHADGYNRQTRGNLVIPHPNGKLSYIYNPSTGTGQSDRVAYYIDYYDGLQDWIREQMACFGLFFTDDEATARNGALDSDNMFLGILDDNNIGHGQYSHGAENRDQKQWNWASTNDSEYDPAKEIDDNTYGRDWGFNPVSIADSTVRKYVMSDDELANFGKYLWDVIDTQNPDELIQNQTLTNFLTNNPLDCVVSLKRFPFADMSQASPVNIVLGKVTVPNVVGRPFTSDAVVRSCGQKKIYPLFEDWRDYICDYFLYLPFCGTIKLDAETVVGRYLYVYYAIDYTTGTCTAYVTTRDDDGAEFYLDSASGNCAIDIPLSGVETATLTGEIYNANENLKALKFNGIVGAAQGALNIAGAASSGSKLAAAGAGLQAGAGIVNAIHDVTTADWNIQHTQIPLKMVGASSGCNSLQGELTPCIIRYYPITDTAYDKNNYLHTVGAACCESSTIGNYSGYAEIVNADLSGIAATADEINMIKNLLAKGVYL